MSSDAHDSPTTGDQHAHVDDHGGDHGHDDHGHEADTLGPVDGLAWGAGAVGILLGLVVAACFALSTGAISAV